MTGKSAVAGADGRLRCPWCLPADDYVSYHDSEWGRRVDDDAGIYERLTLEAFQAGLSWLTILRKRPAFRAAFRGFDPVAVADFGPADVRRLLADRGIVRNRAKIDAAITNARASLQVAGGVAALVWSYAPDHGPVRRSMHDVPAATGESKAMAERLRGLGFRFVGPTTCYALMQACGLVDDHLAACEFHPQA